MSYHSKHTSSEKREKMNKNNKISIGLIIFGTVLFFVTIFLSSYYNLILKIITTVLLISDSALCIVFLIKNYDRNSIDDILYGHRLEIFTLCGLFIILAFAIYFPPLA